MHLKNTLELLIILNLFQSLGKPPLETCLKYFSDWKAKLVETVSSASVNCVCLTSDIWSDNAK